MTIDARPAPPLAGDRPGPPPPAGEGADPATIYRARRDHFARERDLIGRRWNAIANGRLVAFLAAALALGWGVRTGARPPLGLALALFVAFVALVRYHGRLGRRRRRCEELRAISDEALARLARDWGRLPLRHTYRADPAHPYAGDLDLFGPASLFHLLQTSGTSAGEATLRDWLLAPAAPGLAAARQGAVAELAGRIDLRDELAARGRLAGDTRPDPEPFLAWAEGGRWLTARRPLLWGARLSPPLFWATLLLWFPRVIPAPLWLLFLLGNIALGQILGRRARTTLAHVASQEGAFRHYADSFAALDGVSFAAPALTGLAGELRAGGLSAYGHMRRLERIARFIVPPAAISHGLLQLVFLWDVQTLAALEGWQATAGGRARRWLAALGEVEALAALGGLAHAQPEWAFPAVDAACRAVEAAGLGHPLLADAARVVNDVAIGPRGSFLLVTGSNMSGKSTLLRAVGVNEVLAGAGGPVCAGAFRTPPVALWTSMRIQDSLAGGVSYFMAELRRLKAIVDGADAPAAGDGRVPLYLLDEILQGTNTAERQIAARRIVAHLVARGALGVVSTHDLALAEGGALARSARPVHFAERFATGPDGPTMTFDYRLRPGIATSTNALRLMELVGLDLDEPDGARPHP